MGLYGGCGNMNSLPWGLEWAPYGSPTGPYRGPMERYGALRGLGQYGGAPLGLRTGPLWSAMGFYGGWSNMTWLPWGLECPPYGSPTGPYRGPMERYGALRRLEQYDLASLGLRMGPLWEPHGALQGPYGALWGRTEAGAI